MRSAKAEAFDGSIVLRGQGIDGRDIVIPRARQEQVRRVLAQLGEPEPSDEELERIVNDPGATSLNREFAFAELAWRRARRNQTPTERR